MLVNRAEAARRGQNNRAKYGVGAAILTDGESPQMFSGVNIGTSLTTPHTCAEVSITVITIIIINNS